MRKNTKQAFITTAVLLLIYTGVSKVREKLEEREAIRLYNLKYNYNLNEVSDALVPRHDYDLKKLTNEPYNDGKYHSVMAIDVSGYQEIIDWEKVKEAGVEEAYLRIGNRGYSKGDIYLDSSFDRNYDGARAAGIKVGAYFFSQSITVNEAIDEAHFVEKTLNGRELDLEVVYDLEYVAEADARANKLTNELKSEMALAFCQKMEGFGYKAMIYANYDQLINNYNLERVMNYPIWYAQYDTSTPSIPYEFVMWQYTDKGEVDGIEGYVDLNYKIYKN